jgi:hypothetical protein
MSVNAWAKALGEYGSTYITDTTQVNGNWVTVQCLVPTQFAVLIGDGMDGTPMFNSSAGSAPTFPAGFMLFGSIKSIKLHSGSVIAYKSRP